MRDILKPEARRLLTDDSEPDTIGKIIDRQEEQEQLDEEIFNDIKDGGTGVSTTYLYGSSGTGKTYTVKVKMVEAEDNTDPLTFEAEYLNGRKYDTYHKFMVKLLDCLDNRFPVKKNGEMYENVPASGHPTSFFYDLLQELMDQKNFRLMVVMDEIDKLPLDEAGQIISMFWDLKSEGYDVQLVTISNDPVMLEKLDPDINRRIGNKIHFPTYDTFQLYEILVEFAKLALKDDAWEREKVVNDEGQDKDLWKIASEAAQTSGSASEAKKLLYHVAKKSDGELNADRIDDAREKVEKQMIKEEVQSKPIQHIVALQAVAQTHMEYEEAQRNSKRSEEYAPTTSVIRDKYEQLCNEYKMTKKSKRTLVRMMNSLEKDDLISSSLESAGRGKGVYKVHVPMYDAMIYDELAKEAIEQSSVLDWKEEQEQEAMM